MARRRKTVTIRSGPKKGKCRYGKNPSTKKCRRRPKGSSKKRRKSKRKSKTTFTSPTTMKKHRKASSACAPSQGCKMSLAESLQLQLLEVERLKKNTAGNSVSASLQLENGVEKFRRMLEKSRTPAFWKAMLVRIVPPRA